ncbi:MAG: glycosyltransferase family 4 protein [bacterium]|nr:glycosyltransferase family 4 protein [bacterium]
MKILLIHNFYRYRGGEDRYVTILEDLLSRNGHRVIRFFSDSRSIQSFNFLNKCMIPFRLIRSASTDKKLEAVIKKENPDLAIAHNLFPLFSLSLLKVLKRHRIPILKRLENYKFLCLNGLFLRNNFKTCESCKQGNFIPGVVHRCYQRSFFNSLGIALSEYIHRRKKTVTTTADIFLATSGFVKSKFVDAGFPPQDIAVHPNFIDFDPLETPVSPGSPGDYAVYVGRLSREKGLLTLLDAFKESPRPRLKILGEGPLGKELNQIARDHHMEHVEFEGFIDGELKRQILAKALFLVFPSECYESFGYSIIESYACGVPVIASDIGGARELVSEGETGFLFEPGNPVDLRKKIVLLLSDRDRLAAMRQTALEKAKQRYTMETGYRHLEKLLQRLVPAHKDNPGGGGS